MLIERKAYLDKINRATKGHSSNNLESEDKKIVLKAKRTLKDNGKKHKPMALSTKTMGCRTHGQKGNSGSVREKQSKEARKQGSKERSSGRRENIYLNISTIQ